MRWISALNILHAAVDQGSEASERGFLSLLHLLLCRSHFWRMTRRDSEVAKGLNEDYLNQLFILCSNRRLDGDLVDKVWNWWIWWIKCMKVRMW